MSTGDAFDADETPLPRMTVEEYLVFERDSEFRHDFHHGVVTPVGGSYAMAGGSPDHSRVKSTAVRLIGNLLAPRGCDYFDSDMRVDVGDGRYVYPDASATCNRPEFSGTETMRSLTNPTAVFEVLSPTTEADDRGRKLWQYFAIESVRDYVLINVSVPRVEVISRSLNNASAPFAMTFADGLDAAVTVPSLNITLSLRELYHQLSFRRDDDGEWVLEADDA